MVDNKLSSKEPLDYTRTPTNAFKPIGKFFFKNLLTMFSVPFKNSSGIFIFAVAKLCVSFQKVWMAQAFYDTS